MIIYIHVHAIDIDECFEAAVNSIDICEDVENSRCVNAIGSYNCSCVSGYKMMNESCQRKFSNNYILL